MGRDGRCSSRRDAGSGHFASGLCNVLEYAEEPVVSSDIIGMTHWSILDASITQVTSGRFLKALSRYDNEWGYSNRVCELLASMA